MTFTRLMHGLVVLSALAISPALSDQSCGAADTPCSIESGTYHLALPEDDPPKGGIVLLHGGGGKGKGLLKSNLARQALARGYAFIAPNGYHPGARFPNNWAVRARNFGHEKDDIVFIRNVLEDVASRFAVPRERILLAGFSRGGSMVWDVACHAPDTARAYAPSAGAFWVDLPKGCQGPVDLFHTHGWDDRTVPLEGRPLWNGDVVQGDVWESLAILRRTNGCSNLQPDSTSYQGEAWWRHWTDCEGGRIDLMLHPGGHGTPKTWASIVLDWFEARLAD